MPSGATPAYRLIALYLQSTFRDVWLAPTTATGNDVMKQDSRSQTR